MLAVEVRIYEGSCFIYRIGSELRSRGGAGGWSRARSSQCGLGGSGSSGLVCGWVNRDDDGSSHTRPRNLRVLLCAASVSRRERSRGDAFHASGDTGDVTGVASGLVHADVHAAADAWHGLQAVVATEDRACHPLIRNRWPYGMTTGKLDLRVLPCEPAGSGPAMPISS